MSKLQEAAMAYTFDDFYLAPNYSEVPSRKVPDLSVWVDKWQYRLPVVSSPMNTVTGEKMLRTMMHVGGTGVLHRYMDIESQVQVAQSLIGIGGSNDFWVAVGANGDSIERVQALWVAGVRKFCIDVANGHSVHCIEATRRIRERYPDAGIMAGNVCTYEGAYRLAEAGADAVRVGIGPGSLCSTRVVTGHGVPQLSAIEDCARIKEEQIKSFEMDSPISVREVKNTAYPDVALIADGGIRGSGDIVKALAIGADAVMLGSLLAGTSDTPGETHKDPETGMLYKYYHGMACYSHDTEILTKHGWKNISSVTKNDEIGTLNPDTNEMEYQYPTKIFSYKYNGDMINISSRYIDVLVTPNHNLYTKKRKSKDRYKLIEAQNILNKEVMLKNTTKWNGATKDTFFIPKTKSVACNRHYKGFSASMNEWLDFFGFWLAEGSCGKNNIYSVSISNNDKRIIDHYKTIISSWGMRPQIRKRNKNYELTFNDVSVATYLRQFGKAHEKYIPTEIKNLTPKFLHILLNSIFLGDGCKDRNTIYTSSEKLRDDIWEIAFKLGYPASISVSHPEGSTGKIGSKRFKRNHTLWCVGRIGSDIEQTSVTNKNWSIQQYDGNVYCVEVPNHIVCVRRNNKHVWCGNSEEGRASWFDREKTSFVPEGESTKVAYKGSTTRVLDTLVGGMRSGLSYSGAFNIKELREKAVWRRVTGAGSHEARPHGKS